MALRTLSQKTVWGLIALLLCSISRPAFSQPEQPPMPVPVLKVEQVEVPFVKDYPIRLQAFKEVEVHARITANIEKQLYQEGTQVKAGQVLYQLDDRRVKAAFEIAKANLQNAKVRLQNAEVTYERTQKLLKNRTVSEQAVDDAKAEFQAAQSNLQSAEAQLQSAKINLDDATIEAEISGIIGQKQQDVGDLVDPISGKTLLNTIRQTDQLYGLFSISDDTRESLFDLQDQGLIKLADSPKVELLNSKGKAFVIGRLDFQDDQIDPNTASQLYRAVFENKNNRLLPGQLLRVQVIHGTWQNVIAIPQNAVIQNGPQAFVYIAADGKAQMRPITLAGAYEKQWLVSNGLQVGEQIIVGNLIKVRPNSPIQVLDKTSPAGEK